MAPLFNVLQSTNRTHDAAHSPTHTHTNLLMRMQLHDPVTSCAQNPDTPPRRSDISRARRPTRFKTLCSSTPLLHNFHNHPCHGMIPSTCIQTLTKLLGS